MSNHDPISDMLTRIRNASQKKHTTTTIPGSKMSLSIAKVLQKEGFISDINEEGEGYKSQIILGLKYSGKNQFPTIRSMQSAKSDQEGKALLQELGMPFSKN